jgi:hypothetical protein
MDILMELAWAIYVCGILFPRMIDELEGLFVCSRRCFCCDTTCNYQNSANEQRIKKFN